MLDDEDAHIQHSSTGRRVKLYNTGYVFVLCVRTSSASDKRENDHRLDVDVMQESSFTRQEDERRRARVENQ